MNVIFFMVPDFEFFSKLVLAVFSNYDLHQFIPKIIYIYAIESIIDILYIFTSSQIVNTRSEN